MKEIYIYGDIGTEIQATKVINELKGASGEVIVHVNSGGGDVFEAIAIYNSLKGYGGRVITQIDGLAASAASIIACGGEVVRMAQNALLMVHLPSVGLSDYYSAAELSKISASLETVKETLITTYTAKTGKARDEIARMLEAETWLNALQAKAQGFIDEITGASEIEYDAENRILIVNSAKINCKRLDADKLKGLVQEMEDKVFESYKNSVLVAERLRVRNLLSLKGDNEAANAIIDAAIESGKEVEDVQPFLSALSKLKPQNKAIDVVNAQIRDNLNSGAEGVEGSSPAAPAEEVKKTQAAALAAYANQLIGGVSK